MTEYAYGLWNKHKGKIGFFNFAVNITPECDCFNVSEPLIVQDIGVFASNDPVAIDKACYDAVNKQEGLPTSRLKTGFKPGEDKFTGLHEYTKGNIQFEYGEELGMGTQAYEIVEVKPSNHTLREKAGKSRYNQEQYIKNLAKWEAAGKWCKQQGIRFRVVTEDEIFHKGNKRR